MWLALETLLPPDGCLWHAFGMAHQPPAPLVLPDGRPLHVAAEDFRDGEGLALPPVFSFAAVIGGASKTYYHDRFDEAMRHSRENALAMRRDAFLMSLLQERKMAVSSLPWYLETPDPKDKLQAKVRGVLTQCLRGTRGLRRMILSWLEAIWYGRYGNQFSWRWQEVEGRRTLAVDRWAPVNGDKIGYHWDGTPYVLVNAAKAANLPGVVLTNTTRARALSLLGGWRDRFVIHQHEIDDADYFEAEAGDGRHGVGVRSRVYWLDFLKREYLDWVVTYLERVGLGTTLWKYDASSPEQKAKAEEAARDNSRRVNITVPVWPDRAGGYSGGVERIEAPMGGVEALRTMIEAMDQYIERYIIGQAGSSQSQSSGLGNEAASEFMSSTKDAIRDHDAHLLAETITGSDQDPGLLSLMQRYSFPETTADRPNGFPVLFKFGLEKSLNNQRVQTITQVSQMGLPVRKDDIYNAAGLSRPEPHDDVLEPQQQGGPGGNPLAAMMGGGGGPPGEGGVPPDGPDAPGGDDAPASEEDVDAFLDELFGGGGEEGGEPEEDAASEEDVDGFLAELLGGGEEDDQPQQMARQGRGVEQYSDWDESKHPRSEGGQFGSGGMGGKPSAVDTSHYREVEAAVTGASTPKESRKLIRALSKKQSKEVKARASKSLLKTCSEMGGLGAKPYARFLARQVSQGLAWIHEASLYESAENATSKKASLRELQGRMDDEDRNLTLALDDFVNPEEEDAVATASGELNVSSDEARKFLVELRAAFKRTLESNSPHNDDQPRQMARQGRGVEQYGWKEAEGYTGKSKKWIGTDEDEGKKPRYQQTKPGSGRSRSDGGKPTAKKKSKADPERARGALARLKDEGDSPEVRDELRQALDGLTVPQLDELRREFGIRGGGKRKADKQAALAGHKPGEVPAKKPTNRAARVPVRQSEPEPELEALPSEFIGEVPRAELSRKRGEGLLDKILKDEAKWAEPDYESHPVSPMSPQPVSLLGEPMPQSQASLLLSPHIDSAKVGRVLNHLFASNPAAARNLAALVGLPDDGRVIIGGAGVNSNLAGTGDDPVLLLFGNSKAFETAERYVGVDGDGKLYIKNRLVHLNEKHQGKGLGTEMLAKQVEAASAAGISYLKTEASRENGKNGYYTYAVLGFDMDLDDPSIDPAYKPVFDAAKKKFNAKTIQDVMATPEGRAWWKQHGRDLPNARFDLSPDSKSVAALRAYMESKKPQQSKKRTPRLHHARINPALPAPRRPLRYGWEMTRDLGDGRKRWKGTEEHKGQYRTQRIKPGTRVKASGDNRRSIGEHIDTLLESPEQFTPEHRDDLRSKLLTLTRDQFAALRSQFGIRKQGRRKEDEINTLLEGVEERKGPDPRAGRNREGLGGAKVPEKKQTATVPTELELHEVVKEAYQRLHAKTKAIGGTVKLPELVDELKKVYPGLITEQANQMLHSMSRKDLFGIGKVNDPWLEPRSSEGIKTERGIRYYVNFADEDLRKKHPDANKANDRQPQEGDTNAEGLVFRDGHWRREEDPRPQRNRQGLGQVQPPEKRKVSLTPQPGNSPAGGQGEKKMATELETPPVPEHKDTLEITASDHGYRLNRKPYVARISAVYSDGNMERDFVKGKDGDRPRFKKGKQQKYWDTVYEIPEMGIYETQDGDGSREIIAVIPSVTRPGQWANVTIKKDELLRVNKILEDHKGTLNDLDRIGAVTLDDVLRHYSALALQNKQQGGTGSYDDIAPFEEAARQLVELAKVPVKTKSYAVNGKEPWEMTSREWENAANEFSEAGLGGGYGRVGPQAAARGHNKLKRHLDRMAMLRMDLPSVVDEDGILATRSAGHREVVEAAVAAGLPVPAKVLAEYPSMSKGKPPKKTRNPIVREKPSEQVARAVVASADDYRERLGLPPTKHALKFVPLSKIHPSQFGEDYDNESSRELARKTKDGGISDRAADHYPVILDEEGNILDGNHRHAAASMNGEEGLWAVAPEA